ncbi:Synaptosomal-associated protein 29 [Schistosoma japonicum]|nr:Synaptosomal-associated protein 29 [Schistosoma japonicum]
MKKSLNPFDEPGSFPSFSNSQIQPQLGTQSPVRGELLCQISDSQSRTKASQQRALSSIYNSEQVGVAAAQELIEQGEKLSRAELKLEEISELQKESQKKINTLSSVFGGIKNIFSRRQSQPVPQGSSSVNNISNNSNHSDLRQSVQCGNSWGNQYTVLLQQNTIVSY